MQAASTYSRDRCVTGIHGLDEILRGGIPYGSTVLASALPVLGDSFPNGPFESINERWVITVVRHVFVWRDADCLLQELNLFLLAIAFLDLPHELVF